MGQRTCSVDGCDGEHCAQGFCTKHYQRWRKFGDPLVVIGKGFHDPRPLWVRFWERVDRSGGLDTCWPWTATLSKGYGRITNDEGKVTQAHRIVAEWALGPPSAGMHACHHCDNRPCCNPLHLYWGTPKDNSQDMTRRRRGNNGERCPNSKLTNLQRHEIVRRYEAGGIYQWELATEFGIAQATVSDVIRYRHRWE